MNFVCFRIEDTLSFRSYYVCNLSESYDQFSRDASARLASVGECFAEDMRKIKVSEISR